MNWINIKEEEPTFEDCGKRFLCVINHKEQPAFCFLDYEIAEWFNEAGKGVKSLENPPSFLLEYKGINTEATHWMPLPEPPKV